MGLQFSWIEANLLGFFLADVQNSRGKFDEIKEKFAINPTPIASQSSLNAGDHDELEIFLEICLIPSRIDQKLKKEKGEYMLFYREIWPEDGGRLTRSWRRIDGHDQSWERLDLLMTIVASISWQISADRGAIGPRSCRDRGLTVLLMFPRSPSNEVGRIGHLIPR